MKIVNYRTLALTFKVDRDKPIVILTWDTSWKANGSDIKPQEPTIVRELRSLHTTSLSLCMSLPTVSLVLH